jgi:hypothetical protein
VNLLYRPIVRTSVARLVDLPIQDSENDDSKSYKVYAMVL